MSDPGATLALMSAVFGRSAVKTQYSRELAVGARVDSSFALVGREMRSTRSGDAYLSLELADKTGRIAAVCFQPSAHVTAVPVDSIVRVRGVVTQYRGVKRVSVDDLGPASGYDPEDYIQASTRDSEEVLRAFRHLANSVRSRALRRVLKAVFGDTEFFERFSRSPGAQSTHHAHVQGLLEHTVAVATICRHLAELYSAVDGDLLVAAALLHDIGKVDELETATTIRYSDAGRLLGHVVLGERRLRESCRGVRGLPAGLMDRLSHAMLSHHGELEWGSPKRPSTVEALLLHHADNLDAKADGFISLLAGAGTLDERWTDADNLFRRPLYAPTAREAQRSHDHAEDEEYTRISA